MATQDQNNLGVFLTGTSGFFLSITSILALILAFVTQQHVIYLQKSEMQNTMIRDAVIRLETNFFHILEIFNFAIDGMELVKDKITYHGKDCFEILYWKFVSEYSELSDVPDELVRINQAMKRLHNIYGAQLRHYFILAYHLIRYINEKIKIKDDSKFYIDIFKAQLSSFEIALLKYNCISNYGAEKFKPLFQKYKLDEHIQEQLMLNSIHNNL